MVSQTLWDHKHIGRNIVTLTWSAPANCAVDYVEVIYVQQSISKYLYKTGGQEFISCNNGSFILHGNSGSQGFFAGGVESGECIVTARMYYHSNKASTTIAVDKLQYQYNETPTFTLVNTVNISNVYHRLVWKVFNGTEYIIVHDHEVPIGDGQPTTFQTNPATYQRLLSKFLEDTVMTSPPFAAYIGTQQSIQAIVECKTFVDAGYVHQVGDTQSVRFSILFNNSTYLAPSFITGDDVPFGWDDPSNGAGNNTVFHITEGTGDAAKDYYYYLCNITYINFHGTLNLKYGATARWIITNSLNSVNVQGTGSQIDARVTSPTPGPQTFTITVYDSRGYSISVTSEPFTFIAYTPPTVVFSAARGLDTKDGDNLVTKHDKCYGSITYTHTVINNHNTATVTFSYLDLEDEGDTPLPYGEYKKTNTEDALVNDSVAFENPTLQDTRRYRFVATITDTVTQQLGGVNAQYSVVVGTAGAYLHFRPGALGIGGYPTGDKMVYINDDWDLIYKGANIVSAMYPVGSIYMSVNSANPETFFPGTTWTQIQGKFLFAVDKNHAVNSTGDGKLTIDNLPAHTHTLPSSTDSTMSRWFAQVVEYSYDKDAVIPNTSEKRWINTSVIASGNSGARVKRGDDYQHTYEAFENNHTHTLTGPTGSTGSNSPASIMPPYLAVYMWQRTG